MVAPLISVIVPVWNGEDCLARLLDALEAQDASRNAFEVIVADNGSTDQTAAIATARDWVTLVSEPQPGSYRARNRAMEVAKGEWLLFTDADCVPTSGWISEAVRLAGTSDHTIIHAGQITLFREQGGLQMAALFEEMTSFNQQANLARGYAVTANLLCSQALARELDGFRADLLSGGDVDFCRRAQLAGASLAYAPELTVGHPVRAHLGELIGKRRRVLGGLWASKQGQSLRPARLGNRILGDLAGQLSALARAKFSLAQKPGVFAVAALLAGTGALETLRLTLGGKPHRN